MIDSAHRIKFEEWFFSDNAKGAEGACAGSIAWLAYDAAYRQAIEDAS